MVNMTTTLVPIACTMAALISQLSAVHVLQELDPLIRQLFRSVLSKYVAFACIVYTASRDLRFSLLLPLASFWWLHGREVVAFTRNHVMHSLFPREWRTAAARARATQWMHSPAHRFRNHIAPTFSRAPVW